MTTATDAMDYVLLQAAPVLNAWMAIAQYQAGEATLANVETYLQALAEEMAAAVGGLRTGQADEPHVVAYLAAARQGMEAARDGQ